jgi:hypothetical protein
MSGEEYKYENLADLTPEAAQRDILAISKEVHRLIAAITAADRKVKETRHDYDVAIAHAAINAPPELCKIWSEKKAWAETRPEVQAARTAWDVEQIAFDQLRRKKDYESGKLIAWQSLLKSLDVTYRSPLAGVGG